ncbi:UvrD-helicase domain-containing protein [Kocuria rhizophila]|nr:UvrD-helicase domain-containing protein [Kocuria rhizophila]
MSDRVTWLVANGLARPEEILGVTFTRKAAGELSQRIARSSACCAARVCSPSPRRTRTLRGRAGAPP